MKPRALNFCLVVFLALQALCWGERPPQEGPRVPEIAIEEAVKLVLKYHSQQPSALMPVYVDEAIFVRGKGGSYWRIGIRYMPHETGHLFYTVSPDGSVKSDSVVKDG